MLVVLVGAEHPDQVLFGEVGAGFLLALERLWALVAQVFFDQVRHDFPFLEAVGEAVVEVFLGGVTEFEFVHVAAAV